MLTTHAKQKVVKAHQKNEKDTGSFAVIIALLSKKIDELSDHLHTHKKDNHSRRGLIGMVTKRRKLLKLFKKKNDGDYRTLIGKLGLKK